MLCGILYSNTIDQHSGGVPSGGAGSDGIGPVCIDGAQLHEPALSAYPSLQM